MAGPGGRCGRCIACGATYEIGMTFTPNDKGTQLSATNPVKRS